MNPELHMKLRSTGDRPCASSRATRNDAAIQMTQTRAMKKYPSAAPEHARGARASAMVALARLGDLGAGGAGEGMPPRGDARGKVKTTRRRARAKASETRSSARNRSEYRITNARTSVDASGLICDVGE